MAKSTTTATATANAATKDASGLPNAKRIEAARGVLNASQAHEGAQINALAVAIAEGEYTVAELVEAGYSEASAKVRRSQWNVGAELAGIMGQTAARDALDAIAKTVPADVKRFETVLTALRDMRNRAKTARDESPAKAIKPAQVRALVKSAPVAAKDATEKARDNRAKRAPQPPQQGVKAQSAAALEAAGSKVWREAAMQLRLLSNALAAAIKDGNVPEGHDTQCKDAADSVAEACEILAPFLKSKG